MGHVLMLGFWFLSAATIEPIGGPQEIKVRRDTAYVVGADGVSLKINGPGKVMLRLLGATAAGGKGIELTIRRDGAYVSTNTIVLKPAKGGPANYASAGAVGFEVPEGPHTYEIRAKGAATLAFVPAAVPKISKPAMAKPETADAVTPKTNTAMTAADAVTPEESTAIAATDAALDEAGNEKATVAAAAATPTTAVSGASGNPAAKTAAESESEDLDAESAEAMAKVAALSDSIGGSAGGGAGDHESDAGRVARARRVAVYDLGLANIDKSIGSVVTDSLLVELRKLQGISAIGMDEIREMLAFEQAKDAMGCDDVTCLAEIGGALGADDLITGKLSKVGDGNVMLVRRIDQRKATVSGVFDQRLSAGEGEEFLLSVGTAVEKLFPEQPLKPGAQRGVAEEVTLRLHPPPLPPWSVYSVSSGALGAAIAGAVFGILARNAEQEYNDYGKLALTTTVDGATLVSKGNSAERNALIANSLFITSGALALTAGIMSLFTDWQGYSEQ